MSCIPMTPERRRETDRFLIWQVRRAEIRVVLAEENLCEAQQALLEGKDPLEDLILQHQQSQKDRKAT